MEALIGFLKLEDPYLKKSSSVVGGMRGGSLRGSGKNNNPKRRGSNASSLRESITSSITSSSLRSSDTTGENSLRSSLTSSFNNSISKLLVSCLIYLNFFFGGCQNWILFKGGRSVYSNPGERKKSQAQTWEGGERI